MPTYVYKCKACGREFEQVQKFSDAPLRKCPNCKRLKLVRLISGSGLVFKGSGFYLTDYKKKSVSESEPAPSPTKESAEKGKNDASDSTKSEPKTEKTTDSKPPEKSTPKKKK